jgi:indole-3-glycerol phosphate synthase
MHSSQSSFLQKILSVKEKEIAEIKRKGIVRSFPVKKDVFGFSKSICKKNQISLIAEVKKASPSKGVLLQNFDPLAIALEYENAGAAAISVLTDSEYFQGRLEYLRQIGQQVKIPLLRKDFIIDEIQLEEALEAGASAVLLIVAALRFSRLEFLIQKSSEMGLESLVEVHSKEEVQKALDSGAKIIGINNRDLNTFEVNLNTTFDLRPFIPPNVIVVSESGIKTRENIVALRNAKVDAVLIGETLMKAENIREKIQELF